MNEEGQLYVVKHVRSGLYIQERSGRHARWSKHNDEALRMTMPEWEASLSPQLDRSLIDFEHAPYVAQAGDPFGWFNEA